MGGDFARFRELAAVHGGDAELAVPFSSLSDHPLREGADGSLVLTDLRSTERAELELLSGLGVLVGLDEGGPFRDAFPYLIDMLPGLPPRSGRRADRTGRAGRVKRANVRLSPLLPQEPGNPDVSWNNGGESPSILLSFGGEDPAALTRLIASVLVAERFCPAASILTVRGPLSGHYVLPGGVAQAEGVKNLAPFIRHADLLITSFGLTACEAAACGTPVLLCNPSRYHEKLSSANGFSSLGVHRGASNGISPASNRKVRRALRRFFPEGRIDLKALDILSKPHCGSCRDGDPLALLQAIRPENGGECPLCGSRWNTAGDRILFRSRERTVRRCGKCGAAVLFDPFPPRSRYGAEYFFSDYRAQYGRDYLEDFEHICGISRPRVRRTAALLGGGEGKRLLDIGCAYGPFLAAAAGEGFRCEGIEPSEEAASYVRERFGFPVSAMGLQEFLETSPEGVEEAGYDAVTLWFVLEHLPGIHRLLPRLRRILKPGGVLAFSTPSYSGISGRKNPAAFFEASPADHFSIMEPGQAARLVSAYGFKVDSIVSTGIHPDRFGFPCTLFSDKMISRIAAGRMLGDTFELYAVKV
jgi:2-polyprenyl-3-methyl-5-hydroxy-6-metoxy-1,4-benzoquinol methylase